MKTQKKKEKTVGGPEVSVGIERDKTEKVKLRDLKKIIFSSMPVF